MAEFDDEVMLKFFSALDKNKQNEFKNFSVFDLSNNHTANNILDPVMESENLQEALNFTSNKYPLSNIVLETSEEEKFFCSSERPKSHFLIDTLMNFLNYVNKNISDGLSRKIIIYDYESLDRKNLKSGNNIVLLEDYIKKYNINHKILYPGTILIAKNITFNVMVHPSINDWNNVYNFILEFIENKNIVPHKKVYISRSLSDKDPLAISWEEKNNGHIWTNDYIYKNDKRVDDEEKLEEYFKSLGFEIVHAQNFSNITDQINYFNYAKIIVGLTGNGLTNQFFMKNNQMVIELSTPISTSGELLGLTMYHDMSMAKKHTYVSISHDRNAENIIKKINDSYLVEILKG